MKEKTELDLKLEELTKLTSCPADALEIDRIRENFEMQMKRAENQLIHVYKKLPKLQTIDEMPVWLEFYDDLSNECSEDGFMNYDSSFLYFKELIYAFLYRVGADKEAKMSFGMNSIEIRWENKKKALVWIIKSCKKPWPMINVDTFSCSFIDRELKNHEWRSFRLAHGLIEYSEKLFKDL